MKTSKKIKQIQGSKKKGRRLRYLARQKEKENLKLKRIDLWDFDKLEKYLVHVGVLN